MNKKCLLRKKLLLFIVLVPSIVVGQNYNSAAVINLSLDSCLAMAKRNSYDLKIAEQLTIKAQSEKKAIFSKYFPTVSANAGYMYMFENIKVFKDIDPMLPTFDLGGTSIPLPIPVDLNALADMLRSSIVQYWKPIEIGMKGAYMAGVTLQQPLFAGGRIVAGNKMAKTGTEMAKENHKLKQAETLVDAQKTYWLYVSVREKVKLAKSYEKLLTELEKMLTDVSDVEMINRNELMKVQVQHNQVKAQVSQAESGLELSRMALCRIIGVNYGTKINPTDTVAQVTENYILPPDDAVYSRPEYKLMQKQIMLKEGEVKLARGEYLPTLGLGATFGYMGGMKIMNQTQDPMNVSNVMVMLSVPITSWWEGSKKIKSAKTDKMISELQMQKNMQLLELDIKQATFNAINSYQQVKNAEFALEQAKENLRISTDRYMVELETITNLITAQSMWQTAYSDLIDARIDYRIKEVEYQKAIGELE
ncbi:MAG: TolC family protein [Prevotellaceae bacterium]|jgi:outer membrane protein TolC|nr:TolC family protein [Prevotellaceae bacterium]